VSNHKFKLKKSGYDVPNGPAGRCQKKRRLGLVCGGVKCNPKGNYWGPRGGAQHSEIFRGQIGRGKITCTLWPHSRVEIENVALLTSKQREEILRHPADPRVKVFLRS